MRRFDKGPCYMEENDDGRYVLHSDHAAELARVEKENTLLRAECEAVRKMERALDALIVGNLAEDAHAENVVLADKRHAIDQARAATDEAGILKGAGT